jgi:hypothetical protein
MATKGRASADNSWLASGSFPANGAALFENGIVLTPLDLKVDGGIGPVFVKAQAQFVPILIAVNRFPVEAKGIRIKVKTMNRIGKIRAGGPELVDLEIRADEVSHGASGFLTDHVLQFEPLQLQIVGTHVRSYPIDCPVIVASPRSGCQACAPLIRLGPSA